MTDRLDTDDDAALLAWLADEPLPDEWDEPPPDARASELLDRLSTAMRRLRAATLHLERVRRPFDVELDRLTRAREEAVGPRVRDVARCEEYVLMLAAALHRLDGTRTCKLPHGTVASAAGRPKRIVFDEDAAIAWAREHAPTAVKASLLKSNLPDDVDVPGTRVETGERSYWIDV